MWPFGVKQTKPRKRRRTRDVWKPNSKLLTFSKSASLSLDSAYQNIFICGAPGSSKTTGSGAAVAEGLLNMGAGGLVLVAKPDEIPRWLKYCRRNGRSRDVVVLGPNEGFNFINYELERKGSGRGLIENIVDLFSIGCEIANHSQSQKGSGREEGQFWANSRKQLCRNAAVLLKLGHGRVGAREVYELVNSAPTSLEQKNSADWRAHSLCAQCLVEADRRCSAEDRNDLDIAATFFLHEWPTHDHKTRANIASTLTSMIDVLLRGLANEMLCGRTTVTPECLEAGRVVIMGVPLLEYGLPAALIQGIVKFSFQRGLLRRNVAKSPRPVFIFADEFQCFLNSFDQEFLAMSRSARVVNVCLTQNIPNLYAALGGEQRGKSQVDSILGNMNLKIMHANGEPTTNEWASNCIGHSKQYTFNANSTNPSQGLWPNPMGYGLDPQVSAGMSESYQFEVQPSEFTRLRPGGRRHGWNADAIVFQSGHTFADTGKTWRRATFRQKF